ncbi:MAG: YaeQ family protein [Cycloclasticus pugetii]|uniref:YaeQ family protein n=1 Tax=Cycloclasticus TaxID=34067 RepID=UPI00257A6FF8|nr:YaeQ family protein [Cycloclasticus sp.]MBV1898987.1 YaeQ family protein [Cycloclasticus sp.]
MAIGSTINKVSLSIANMDSHYYATHELTVAQHPSENDFRLMVRLIAFIANANENLTFTKGLSTDDEPELWQKSLTGEIELWVELGQPDEKRIRKACGRAQQVIIYTYHEGKATVWWQQHGEKLARFKNLSIVHITASGVEALAGRTMNLQCNIQDGEMYLSDNDLNQIVNLKSY